MSTDILWQTKLAARLHDPAEKALVLLRDPAGHENGTSVALARLAGLLEMTGDHVEPDNDAPLSRSLFKKGLPSDMYRRVQRADWWAAAADRPQWPMEEVTVTQRGKEQTRKVARWAQVHWTNEPILIHPLTGDQFRLPGGLAETDFHDIKQRNFAHASSLLAAVEQQQSGERSWKKMLLALWRFGPEVVEEDDRARLGALWNQLPADTRVPDHSIWDHLDLTSAFAGAFTADARSEASLLALSLGPVQPFIAAARKMDDLWAGSHLLARLSWEAMKVVCERLGPDAILFPCLRGIPQVDLWLRDECGLPGELFDDCEWKASSTDSNPLFIAALPNRFVAVVPASQAASLAREVEDAVRRWMQELGKEVVELLLAEAGFDVETTPTPFDQMRSQLAGFPEVHWAAVPFSLIATRDEEKQTALDPTLLSEAMAPFFDCKPGEVGGFLSTDAWQLLQEELQLIDKQGRRSAFFSPNPGVLYPAVHDLAERLLAASKSVRPYEQCSQVGWRCSLTGESEWLTTDRAQLATSHRQMTDTLWARIAARQPAWARPGEHLGALSAIKRLWPRLFADEVALALGEGERTMGISRFVVSTHTMALAHQLERWLEKGGELTEQQAYALARYRLEPVALPRRLARRHGRNRDAFRHARLLPALLDIATGTDVSDEEAREIRQLVRQILGRGQDERDDAKLETYYSLLLMDGDRMGAWLSGGENHAITYRESFHPQVKAGFDEHAARQPRILAYGRQLRPVSPNRHLAISSALNDFSLSVARHVVEEEHLGRLIYAGGDDVFAMFPVSDLLPAMQRLRHAYSGTLPDDETKDWGDLRADPTTLHCKRGFAFLNGRLMRMMGARATASAGAVIAHHQAPLSAVRRELVEAEKRAKNFRRRNENGQVQDRDAFSLTIVKRSGGTLYLTESWGEPMALLCDMRAFLSRPGVSRRAVYHTLEWLQCHTLPLPSGGGEMLQALLEYQFERQVDHSVTNARALIRTLSRRLVALTLGWPQHERIGRLRNFLSVAEFLAREIRRGGDA